MQTVPTLPMSQLAAGMVAMKAAKALRPSM
jgi:hypothetical protein